MNSSRKYHLRAFAFTALAAAAFAAACGPAVAAGPEPFESEGRWGYRDEAGLTVIEPGYAAAGQFSEGVAQVRLPDGEWALINRSGAEIQRSSSPVLGVISGGLAVSVRNGKFGYTDAAGQVVIPHTLSGAGVFSENLAPARKESWGFINRSGNFVIGPGYEAARPFSGGLAAFRKNGRWGFLKKNGKQAVKNIFYDVRDFSGGLAAVRANSLWGYIDTEGRLALAPDYETARPFAGGIAVVSLPAGAARQDAPLKVSQTKWIDREGAAVYSSLGPAGDGLEIILSSAGRYGFAKGLAPAVPAQFEAAAGCGSGLCLVGKGGRLVFIDHYGGTVLETDFDGAARLDCGLYRVSRQRKYGVIGSTGRVIAQPLYDSIEGSGCEGGLAAVMNGAAGRLDSLSGDFAAGLSPNDPPPVKPGEKCLSVEKTLAQMNYADIPGYCAPDELRSLLRTNPGCLNCRLALAEIYSSTASGKGPSDREAALEALSEAMSISPEPARLHQWRINLMLSATAPKAYADGLLEDYRRLIRLEPYKPEHYRAICRAYGLLSSPPEDIRSSAYNCDLAVKMDTETPYNLVSRANFRKIIGDVDGALEDLRTVIEQHPQYKEGRLARARLSAELGQDFRAVFDCSKLLESDMADPEALEERALAYIRMGVCDKALADLESAGALRPGAGNMHKMAVYRWLCERDIPGTLALIDELLKPSKRCGGSCWRPAEYEKYLGDLYGTGPYTEMLNKYLPPDPQAPAVQAAPSADRPDDAVAAAASAAARPALPGTQSPRLKPAPAPAP